MSRIVYKTQLIELKDHTPNVRELLVKMIEPQEFKFRAGQFAMLHVPQENSKPALRAYSIASSEADSGSFRLLFKFVENGVASNYVWSLKGGETLQFTGPFGKVFFQEPPTDQIIFMNTGTGLSQHLSYLISKKNQYPNLKYRLLFGVRTTEDIYHKDVLDQLKNELADFKYDYVLSRPDSKWSGKTGYIQDHLKDFEYQKTPTTFYLCGNGGMIKAVKTSLEEIQFDKSKIWAEAFD
jgi:CDP-4-dehydro-6-deoxyglucose reductase, E3